MIRKTFVTSIAAIGVIASVSGCSTTPVQTAYGPMPEYCTQNNTATGAIIGTLIGAGLGAAIGGGRGAAIGAISGLALGGATGAQADQQCRQIALQRAFEIAAAQEAAAARAAAQQAAIQQVAFNQANAQPPVAYEPVEYTSPSNGQRHKITHLKTYTNPMTKDTCRDFDVLDYGEGNISATKANTRVCQGADGKIHET
jgi:predicted lipid-binding transport protein (Tim44 family)